MNRKMQLLIIMLSGVTGFISAYEGEDYVSADWEAAALLDEIDARREAAGSSYSPAMEENAERAVDLFLKVEQCRVEEGPALRWRSQRQKCRDNAFKEYFSGIDNSRGATPEQQEQIRRDAHGLGGYVRGATFHRGMDVNEHMK